MQEMVVNRWYYISIECNGFTYYAKTESPLTNLFKNNKGHWAISTGLYDEVKEHYMFQERKKDPFPFKDETWQVQIEWNSV